MSTKAKLIEESGQKRPTKAFLPSVDQEKKEKNAVAKLYPDSYLFATWGDGLSEEEQKEAEALFQIYGYNSFLSNRMPLDRKILDMRDSRYYFLEIICNTHTYKTSISPNFFTHVKDFVLVFHINLGV